MCRNIKRLHNLAPAADEAEARDAALQFVRKVSGSRRPSQTNAAAFERAVDEITASVVHLLATLESSAPPVSREELAARGRARWERRTRGSTPAPASETPSPT